MIPLSEEEKEQNVKEINKIRQEKIARGRIIVRTSVIGIVTNILLAGFKGAVGLTTNSIAILLDAVNNLSDALSSVITVAGAKLAGRKPDWKHPFGHGRYEYFSAMIIAAIVFYAGLTSLWESVKKIIEPEAATYTSVSLLILTVAIVVKILLGRYAKRQGILAESDALEASGADAMFDALLSFSVLITALVYIGTGISLEAYVGAIISLFILKAGIDMMKKTLNDLLGERPDPELVRKIRAIIISEPEVHGAYDLMLNNYGPERNYASVHIDLPDTMTVEQADRLTRHLHPEAIAIRKDVYKIMMKHRDQLLQVHGFYVDRRKKEMRFDIVVKFGTNIPEMIELLEKEVKEAYPDYDILIDPDMDISALGINR